MDGDFDYVPFGLVVRRLRKAAGLTQEALAALVEVDQTTVSNWEKREDALTDAFVMTALADALMTTVDDLRAGKVRKRRISVTPPRPTAEPARSVEWFTLLQEYNPGLYASMAEVARQVVAESERRRFGDDAGGDDNPGSS